MHLELRDRVPLTYAYCPGVAFGEKGTLWRMSTKSASGKLLISKFNRRQITSCGFADVEVKGTLTPLKILRETDIACDGCPLACHSATALNVRYGLMPLPHLPYSKWSGDPLVGDRPEGDTGQEAGQVCSGPRT